MVLQDARFSATGKIKDEMGRGLPFPYRLVSLKTSYFLASAEALIVMACSHTTTAVALHIFFFRSVIVRHVYVNFSLATFSTSS